MRRHARVLFAIAALTSFFAFAAQAWAEAPTLTIDPVDPGTVTATEAEFTGTVNPNGLASGYELDGTLWRFEYSADGGSTWRRTTSLSAGKGTSPVAVSTTPKFLNPNSDYEVRLWAENLDGITVTSPVSFHTDQTAPLIDPLSADLKTATSARLRAQLNPAGEATTYHFEYGTSSAYGSSTSQASSGSGVEQVLASQVVQGLQPGTTYHYRVIAQNGTGTAVGADRTFTTGPAVGACPNEAIRAEQQWAANLTECRAYEQVTPVEKNGVGVPMREYITNDTQVAPDGEGAYFAAEGAFPGAPTSIFETMYTSRRGDGGWSTKSIMPPLLNIGGLDPTDVAATSEDLSHSVVISPMALTSDAVYGQYNVYLRDNATETYELIYTSVREPGVKEGRGTAGGDSSFDKVLLLEPDALTPDAPDNGKLKLYVFSGGTLRLVSLMPDGSPAENSIYVRELASLERLGRTMSADGRRIFFSPENDGLYVREGDRTKPISVSERTGEVGEVKPAVFNDASRDGSIVYFTSRQPLTDESWSDSLNAGSSGSLYRYDLDTGELLDLTVTSDPDNTFGPSVGGTFVPTASPDGSSVFFVAAGKLTPDAAAGEQNLYVWHEDPQTHARTLRLVMRAPSFSASGQYGETSASLPSMLRVSPNGLHAAIQTGGAVAGQPAPTCSRDGGLRLEGPCLRVWAYDLPTDQVECASCPRTASANWGHAIVGNLASNPVTDDGRVFFQTPARLNPQDSNNQRDVYEWNDGRQNLISSGRADTESVFLGASLDARNVYFTTDQQLVPQDTDDVVDLYDARMDGGLASQMVRPEKGSCEGEACQPPIVGAKPPAATGSASFQGPPNQSAQRKAKKKRHAKKRHAAKHRKAGKKHGGKAGKGKKHARNHARSGK